MKQSKLLFASLLLGTTIASSCGDVNRNIEYNSYTRADTEAFVFLKKAYEEAIFQQYAAKEFNLGAQSANISQTYQTLTDELEKLATENRVAIPSFSASYFPERGGSYVPDVAPVVADTLLQPDLADKAVAKETPVDKIIHSQEEIIYQFEVATRNTNTSIRDFAVSKLPALEELLEQSKSSIK